MLSKEEIKKWLLENCVDEDGDLDLTDLDFSDFGGNVYISGMKVAKSLYQNCQEVGCVLLQDCQKAGMRIEQGNQESMRINQTGHNGAIVCQD